MVIIVKELGLTSEDVENHKDTDELKILKIKVDVLSTGLQNKLDDYNCKYKNANVSGDYEWFKRAKTKKRLYGLMSQLIQQRIGILNKQERQKEWYTFKNRLIDKLKQHVGKELFSKLVEEAKFESEFQNNQK